jgi:hypothetical protein
VDYILGKFADNDVVFVGEFHRIRWQVELVADLVPALYAVGVRDLGFEFACPDDQAAIYACLRAPVFDPSAVKAILFSSSLFWGFQEYADIFEAAWKVNHGRPAGAPPFRIIALTHREAGEQAWAETLLDEVLREGRKALVYCGINHALTRFEQPFLDEASGEVEYVRSRFGQFVRREVGERVFTVCLHMPGTTRDDSDYLYPFDGALDALLEYLPPERRAVAFDTRASPLGRIVDSTGKRSLGYGSVTLEEMYDGYILHSRFADNRGVRPINDWLDRDNFAAALDQLIPAGQERHRWIAEFLGPEAVGMMILSDADIERRFRVFR